MIKMIQCEIFTYQNTGVKIKIAICSEYLTLEN